MVAGPLPGRGCAEWVMRSVTVLAEAVVIAVGARPNHVVHRETTWLGAAPGAPPAAAP